jgi:hypothetical protein
MFDKLDAYDLIANLVPGAALLLALKFSSFAIPSPNEVGPFLIVAFVMGVTVNRLGSVTIDPFLRWAKFLRRKNYGKFVLSERSDRKLETLVANAGLYRSFVTAAIVYGAAMLFRPLFGTAGKPSLAAFAVLVAAGAMIFLFALRKEDGYIHTRISSNEHND